MVAIHVIAHVIGPQNLQECSNQRGANHAAVVAILVLTPGPIRRRGTYRSDLIWQENSRVFSGHIFFPAGGSGRVWSKKKKRGSSRVASEGLRQLTGLVGSGQEAFKYHGPGRVTLTRSAWCGIVWYTEQ